MISAHTIQSNSPDKFIAKMLTASYMENHAYMVHISKKIGKDKITKSSHTLYVTH